MDRNRDVSDPQSQVEESDGSQNQIQNCDEHLSKMDSKFQISVVQHSPHDTSVDHLGIASGTLSFRKLPDLSRGFKKIKVDSKIWTKCEACGHVMRTVELARIMQHARKCRKVSNDYLKLLESGATALVPSPKPDRIDREWAKVMIENNISPYILDSPSFKYFCSKYILDWRLPDRKKLSMIMRDIVRETDKDPDCDRTHKMSKRKTKKSSPVPKH